MMNTDIRWQTVGKEDLLDALLGEINSPGWRSTTFPTYEVASGRLALGYSDESSYGDQSPPLLVVVGDESVADTMSWLRVYASEASPVSQFARVVLASDWQVFSDEPRRRISEDLRPDRWACVTVGEALAQVEGDTDLQSMELSRASSCFSLPVGRTTLLFGQGSATRICVDRLRSVGGDRRFGRRAVTVDELLPIWAIAGANFGGYVSPEEAAAFVIEAAATHLRNSLPSSSRQPSLQLDAYPGLSSDSIEERVIEFNRLSQEFTQLSQSHISATAGPILAAAAFLVGRSTSHAFLLRRLSRVSPAASAWFGVMAALAGPRAWDAAWLRAVKGAERLLKPNFHWLDVSAADICWPEFAWLARTFDDASHLSALPKMLPRTLGVEIVPGVTIQLRLNVTGQAEHEIRTASDPTARERALQDALGQFISLAQKVRSLTDEAPASITRQQSLDLGGDQVRIPKSPRNKRKRGPSES